MRIRILLGGLGLAVAAYGAWLLLGDDLADLVTIAVWLAAGVVLHDFVLVPLTLGVSWLGLRVLPDGSRAAASAGLVVLGTLTVLAVPVLGRWGANTDNTTILDRHYGLGWLAIAGLTIMGVLLVLVAKRRSGGPGARRR
jgi:hypothetical protein